MAKDIYSQTLAFAAICQASAIIQDWANFGTWDEDAAAVLIKSLASDSSDDVFNIYPETYMKRGYYALVQSFSGPADSEPKNIQLAKYVITFINLERKISKSATAITRLRKRLEDNTIDARNQHLGVLDTILIENLSGIYKSEISDTGIYKFNIYGKKLMLQQPHIQHRIRAMILAAVKAVIHWRLSGGRRLNFIFKRGKMVECSNEKLKKI